MRRISRLPAAVALGFLFGCISLPDISSSPDPIDVAEIEMHAEQLLDYIEGKIDVLPRGVSGESPQLSSVERAIDGLIPAKTVYAAELTYDSDLIREVVEFMRARHQEISALHEGGAVGESNRGLLKMVHPDLIADPEEKNVVQRAIAAENKNRKALYKEIARLNRGHNLRVGILERVYAQKRLMRGETGELFQLPPPGGDFDKFKNSPRGRRLGPLCIPNAWVALK